MSAPRALALSCRSCGAPCAEPPPGARQTRCGYCGAEVPFGPAVRRHLARIRRTDARLRVLLRQHLSARLMIATRRPAILWTLGTFLLAFVGGLLPLGLLVALHEQVGEGEVIGLASCSGCFMTAALLGPLLVGFGLMLRLGRQVPVRARQIPLNGRTTAPTRCGSCGGYAAVAVVGPPQMSPCPWCGAALAGRGGDAETAAVEALEAQYRATGEALLARATRASGATLPEPLGVEGYTGHGELLSATFGDVAVWASSEMLEGATMSRVEASRDTALPGRLWLVPTAGLAAHLRAAEELGQPPPPQVGPVSATHTALADPEVDVARYVDGLRASLEALGPEQALHLDPAGGAIWAVHAGRWGMVPGFLGFVKRGGYALAQIVAGV